MPLACVPTVAVAWQSAQFGEALCFGCACVVSVAESVPWHSVQLLVPPIAVFQVYAEHRRRALPVVVAEVDPAGPERAAVDRHRVAAAGVYVKVRREGHRAVPCVATVAVAWQSLQTAPAPVSVVRCGPCEFVASVEEVALWHSVQLFVAPIAVFQV